MLSKGFNREYAKLKREAQILGTLRHRYITSLTNVFEQKESLYLVMELIKGGELFDQIVYHNIKPYKGHMSEPEARYVFIQVASALEYIHGKQIVHRDLKPENILVVRNRRLLEREALQQDYTWNTLMEYDLEKACQLQAYDIKISDFGLAKLIADGYSIATTRTGTPQYWAPEVAASVDKNLAGRSSSQSGSRNQQAPQNAAASDPEGYSFSADLWSLGVIMYVMLCGKYPFDGQNSGELIAKAKFDYPSNVSDLSDLAKNLIENLVVKDPRDRMPLKHCLKCKWATLSMIHLKCKFYRPKVPLEQWNQREILLPIRYDEATARTTKYLCKLNTNMDKDGKWSRSGSNRGNGTNLYDDGAGNVEDEPPNEMDIVRNHEMLDTLWAKISEFRKASMLDDILDFDLDVYGERFFTVKFRYMLPESEKTGVVLVC